MKKLKVLIPMVLIGLCSFVAIPGANSSGCVCASTDCRSGYADPGGDYGCEKSCCSDDVETSYFW